MIEMMSATNIFNEFVIVLDKIDKIEIFDQFPNTSHLEIVSVLKKNEIKEKK